MAKITVDTDFLAMPAKYVDMVYQVAARTYSLLNGVARRPFEGMVEIIKVTTGVERRGEDVIHFATFQIVCELPTGLSPSTERELRITAKWDNNSNEMWVYTDGPHGHERTISAMSLPDAETETMARALIWVIQIGFRHYRSRLSDLTDWLVGKETALEPLTKVPAKA